MRQARCASCATTLVPTRGWIADTGSPSDLVALECALWGGASPSGTRHEQGTRSAEIGTFWAQSCLCGHQNEERTLGSLRTSEPATLSPALRDGSPHSGND